MMLNRTLPIGWKKLTLEDVVEFNPRWNMVDKSASCQVSFIPMSGISDEGKVINTEVRLLKDVYKGYTYFADGDVLFAKITPCMENGKRALIKNLKNGIGFGSTEYHVLRAKDDIIPEFLYYLISSPILRKRAEASMTGSAGQKRVPISFLKSYAINLPPKKIQWKIVETIDKIQSLIDMRKKQIELLDELIQSVFIDMFGDPLANPQKWNLKTVKEICPNIYGGGTPSKKNPEYYIGEIPWVTPKDMKALYINDSIDHINEIALKNSSTKLIPKNSVIMVIRSGILKRYLPVAINLREVTINQDMKAFIADTEIVTIEYLLYCFILSSQFILSKVRAVTADNFEFQQIKELALPVPHIELQIEFTKLVNKINLQKRAMEKNLNNLETNFNSIMQKAFRGELFT